MATETFTTLFDAGEGEGYWKIEEGPDGLLYATSNAETRRAIDSDRHRGWDFDELRRDLAAAGMPEGLIRRYCEQAEAR